MYGRKYDVWLNVRALTFENSLSVFDCILLEFRTGYISREYLECVLNALGTISNGFVQNVKQLPVRKRQARDVLQLCPSLVPLMAISSDAYLYYESFLAHGLPVVIRPSLSAARSHCAVEISSSSRFPRVMDLDVAH
jgi:hypothetical protein